LDKQSIDANSEKKITGPAIFQTISDRECHLENGIGSSFLHVITRDRYTVKLWHVLKRKRFDVMQECCAKHSLTCYISKERNQAVYTVQ
jgi:hypothetical protein